MDEQLSYKKLRSVYELSRSVCDPLQYQVRQQNLLSFLAMYLLERDKPIDETKDEGI
ncbi:MAG: hypothetical protein WC089_03755 [Candidatus Paceibacterota bacterium]